jgi:hypothetical protein
MKLKYSKIKILSAVALVCTGFYYAFTQPGPMDCVNATVHGFVLASLFVIEDPKPEKKEE